MRRSFFKLTVALALAGAWSLAAGCGDDGPGGADGGGGAGGSGGIADGAAVDTGQVACVPTFPTACPTPPVTYGKIQPIFQARCVSTCHSGTTLDPSTDAAIWSLTDYKHVKDWESLYRDSIGNCTMPPPDAGVPLTVEERQAILEFVRCGLPQ